MTELNNCYFNIVSPLLFLLLLISCTSGNKNGKNVIVGEITEITFDILKEEEHYCHITRAYISTTFSSTKDTIIRLKSVINSPGCNFENNSNLLFKLNDIELPIIAISSDSIIKLELNNYKKSSLDFSIQQGTNINFGLDGENSVDKLKYAIKHRDDFLRLLNSDSLQFSSIINEGSKKKINIKANNRTDIIYQLDGKLINKQNFSKEYFNEVPPPKEIE